MPVVTHSKDDPPGNVQKMLIVQTVSMERCAASLYLAVHVSDAVAMTIALVSSNACLAIVLQPVTPMTIARPVLPARAVVAAVPCPVSMANAQWPF